MRASRGEEEFPHEVVLFPGIVMKSHDGIQLVMVSLHLLFNKSQRELQETRELLHE